MVRVVQGAGGPLADRNLALAGPGLVVPDNAYPPPVPINTDPMPLAVRVGRMTGPRERPGGLKPKPRKPAECEHRPPARRLRN